MSRQRVRSFRMDAESDREPAPSGRSRSNRGCLSGCLVDWSSASHFTGPVVYFAPLRGCRDLAALADLAFDERNFKNLVVLDGTMAKVAFFAEKFAMVGSNRDVGVRRYQIKSSSTTLSICRTASICRSWSIFNFASSNIGFGSPLTSFPPTISSSRCLNTP